MDDPDRRTFMRAAAMLAVAQGARLSAQSGEVMVETADGRLGGLAGPLGLSFKGIPYAADTAGANRFMAPRPVSPWAGVRSAVAFGARAPQGAGTGNPSSAVPRQGEDCCVLNVYAATLRPAAPRPVMVFVHGGGFRSGSGDTTILDGALLARAGEVVVVTLNRRLNVLGFACLGEVDPALADAPNAGQLDVISALAWVRTNIAAFGGDAGRVMVFGVSGGGSAVETLSIMPGARGLFHRTANMSGTSAFGMQREADLAPVAETFLRSLSVQRGDVRRLQAMPYASLARAYGDALRQHGTDYRPVVDGRHIPHAPLSPAALASGTYPPGIMSCTADEASAWLAGDRRNVAITAGQLRDRVERQFGLTSARAGRIIQTFQERKPDQTPWNILVAIATEALTHAPMRRAAEAKAAAGIQAVYCSEFRWKSPVDGGIWGASHGSDVAFVFGTIAGNRLTAGVRSAEAVCRAQMAAMVALARTGAPSNTSMPPWRSFDIIGRQTMTIDVSSRMEKAPQNISDLPDQDPFSILSGPLFVG